MTGPVPKRSEERRRRNKPDVEITKVDVDSLLAEPVDIPVVNEDWDPIARLWYESLARSGQSIFYEPSDWATAYLLAEQIDRELKPQPIVVGSGEEARIEMMTVPMKGASMTAILKGMAALMTTEGERRRVRIELERKKAQDAMLGGDSNVVSIAKSRDEAFARARKHGAQEA